MEKRQGRRKWKWGPQDKEEPSESSPSQETESGTVKRGFGPRRWQGNERRREFWRNILGIKTQALSSSPIETNPPAASIETSATETLQSIATNRQSIALPSSTTTMTLTTTTPLFSQSNQLEQPRLVQNALEQTTTTTRRSTVSTLVRQTSNSEATFNVIQSTERPSIREPDFNMNSPIPSPVSNSVPLTLILSVVFSLVALLVLIVLYYAQRRRKMKSSVLSESSKSSAHVPSHSTCSMSEHNGRGSLPLETTESNLTLSSSGSSRLPSYLLEFAMRLEHKNTFDSNADTLKSGSVELVMMSPTAPTVLSTSREAGLG